MLELLDFVIGNSNFLFGNVEVGEGSSENYETSEII